MTFKKIAIVTGASGGLGRAFAELLAGEELDEIWAIARSEEKLGALREVLGEKIRPFALDLTESASFAVISHALELELPEVRYLVNNAGYGKFGDYSDVSMVDSMGMIDLNVSAVVRMGLIVLPYMQKGAHLINIASQASFQPLPYLNIYAATKAFVRNYTRALNVELADRGITATAVCPGWIRTGFFARGDIGADKTARRYPHMADPRDVAKKALRDARRGRDMSVFGGYVKLCHLGSALVSQKTAMRFWLRMQKLR